MIDVALFPIPNCVAFPATILPLHVFEPRYRTMVQFCIDNNSLLGICHVEELLKPAKRNQSLQQALHTDQATYKPYSIFSAGKVVLRESMEDGRLLIDVHLAERLKAVDKKQTTPFLIYSCETYQDYPLTDKVIAQALVLKDKLLKRLLEITAENQRASNLFASSLWQEMELVKFSFQLFGLLQMGGDIQQQILQCRSPLERLNIALQLLNKV